jgi:hypothetical protein
MSTIWHTFAETDQHRKLRDDIRAALGSWRRFLIAVDGVDGAGKSNLARYLAWQLGMSAIETDLFLDSSKVGLNYRFQELRSAISKRLSRDRPVIVEGVAVLRLLRHLSLTQEYLVWVEQEGHDGSHSLGSDIAGYEAEFTPRNHANSIFKRPPDDLTESAL